MSDIRSYLSPSALRPLPYKGKVRSTFIFVQNNFSDKSLLLLLYYILPTYVCRVAVGFISMLLTYISDISVEKHLPYRIIMALKLTLFSVFFELRIFYFFSFFRLLLQYVSAFFRTVSLCLLHFLYFLAGVGFFYVDFTCKGSDQREMRWTRKWQMLTLGVALW